MYTLNTTRSKNPCHRGSFSKIQLAAKCMEQGCPISESVLIYQFPKIVIAQ